MNIQSKALSKKFGSFYALHDVNLSLEEDKIYGLLGKNGAGKTTLMHLMAGHLLPTSGDILLNGSSPFNNRAITKDVCLINESSNFKRRLKVKDILYIASQFYPNWSADTAERLLKQFNLKPKLNTKGLSKGMESALGIIIGLSSRAKVTILDEPYIGLDASARYTFYDILLEEYEAYPRTIILSTHLIDEVSNLFEEVMILKEGSLLLHEPADELIEKSLHISGKKEAVDAFCEGKHILGVKEMMGRKTANLFDENLSIEEAVSMGLEAERMTIQDITVHLSGSEEELSHA